MADPVIIFNASTGSDSAASGAGPGTALTGTGASVASSTSADLSADAPDLSGVATDGSAVLWVDTASGRQFSKITAVDNGTKIVTVESAYGVTASGLTWAIGGKRATFDNADSRKLFADYLAGWIIETETDQSLTSAIVPSVSLSAGTRIVIRGSGAFKVITQTASGVGAFAPTGGRIRWQNIQFKQSHATKEYSVVDNGGTTYEFHNCICGDANGGDNPKGFVRRGTAGTSALFVDCEARYCTEDGFGNTTNRGSTWAHGCSAHHCGRNGFATRGDGDLQMVNCISYLNSDNGAHFGAVTTGRVLISQCTIDNNGGDGVEIAAFPALFVNYNNNFTGNGGYGLNLPSASDDVDNLFHDHNNYGTGGTANTSGAINNGSSGANDLAVDPGYADAANGNFEAGTNVKAQGYPDSSRTIGANQSATNAFMDIGIQREEAGGGGTVNLLRGKVG